MRTQQRINWLKKDKGAKLGDTEWFDFDPQPYTHLAKIYEAAGNRNAASDVRYERECRIREAAQRRAEADLQSKHSDWWKFHKRTYLMPIIDGPYRVLFGYGEKPGRALWYVGGLLLFTYALFRGVFAAGQMAPNSDVILTSTDWLKAVALYDTCMTATMQNCVMPLVHWVGDASLGIKPMPSAVDYETFSPLLYALDLFVPLDALGQEQAWAPSKDRGVWGAFAYWLRMPIQVSGWVITAVGAGVLTGLVGRKE